MGSAVDANTATTMAFLPRCDAALFVTSVDTPLTAVETELLSRLPNVRKIIFVINKTDLLDAPECREVVAYIVGASAACGRRFLESLSNLVQTRAGGETGRRPGGIQASGLGPLEAAISSFLAVEKSSTFLVAVLDKAATIASAQIAGTRRRPAGGGHLPSKPGGKNLRNRLDRFRQLNADRDRDLLHLCEQAQQRAAKTIDAEFRSFLSEQTPLLLEQLHRAVDDSHGWLASGVAKLAAGRWLKDLGAKLTEWIGSLKPRLEEEINQATGPAKASLESQLAAIPSVAGSVLSGVVDAPLPQTDAEPRSTRCICPSSLRDSQSGPRK